MKVFDYLVNEITPKDKELYAPETIYKDRTFTKPNYPETIPYGDMEILKVRDITKKYDGRAALDGVSFDVERGEFLSILGPSGCGKTLFCVFLSVCLSPTAEASSSRAPISRATHPISVRWA